MTMYDPRRGRRSAFTLIELLIVIAILATLAALTIPAVFRARESANRYTCTNNLRQFGIACQGYHNQQGYLPTAGFSDLSAPSYSTTSNAPDAGYLQTGGWAFQILPYMDAEVIWTGDPTLTGSARMQVAVKSPHKFFFCPSRRRMTTKTYQNAGYPANTAYSTLLGTSFTASMIDYAGCNGNSTTILNTGAIRSQSAGRMTVQNTDITDGLSHTILLGEKAVNMNPGVAATVFTNEDDMGYTAGFSATNFNTIRFTAPALLPVFDRSLVGASNGAFGSSHAGTWNALLADGSVQQLSYTIDPTIFSGLGTIAGREIITDADLGS
jgi:prepilin-type N-terminal cleavage/methylation domain-containing protein